MDATKNQITIKINIIFYEKQLFLKRASQVFNIKKEKRKK